MLEGLSALGQSSKDANGADEDKVAQSPLVEQIVLNTLHFQAVSWISVCTSDRSGLEENSGLSRECLGRQGKSKERAQKRNRGFNTGKYRMSKKANVKTLKKEVKSRKAKIARQLVKLKIAEKALRKAA